MPAGRCRRRQEEDALGQAPRLAARWWDLRRVTLG